MNIKVEDFQISNYQNLVRYAVENFTQAQYDSPDGPRRIIWRHDCDFSLSKALTIGKIDQQEGMRATFFINIHANTYNALSLSGQDKIRSIIQQEHEIGIHLDPVFYGGIATIERLTEILQFEKQQYLRHFGTTPKAFSFHNPTDLESQFQNDKYAGLINCYSKKFRDDWRYGSDSNGYWRHKAISEVLHEDVASPLQVLTHAEWWSDKPQMPRERLVATLLLSTYHEIIQYDRSLSVFGRSNFSAIEEKIRDIGGTDIELHLILTALYSLMALDSSFESKNDSSPFQSQIDALTSKMTALDLIQLRFNE